MNRLVAFVIILISCSTISLASAPSRSECADGVARAVTRLRLHIGLGEQASSRIERLVKRCTNFVNRPRYVPLRLEIREPYLSLGSDLNQSVRDRLSLVYSALKENPNAPYYATTVTGSRAIATFLKKARNKKTLRNASDRFPLLRIDEDLVRFSYLHADFLSYSGWTYLNGSIDLFLHKHTDSQNEEPVLVVIHSPIKVGTMPEK